MQMVDIHLFASPPQPGNLPAISGVMYPCVDVLEQPQGLGFRV